MSEAEVRASYDLICDCCGEVIKACDVCEESFKIHNKIECQESNLLVPHRHKDCEE